MNEISGKVRSAHNEHTNDQHAIDCQNLSKPEVGQTFLMASADSNSDWSFVTLLSPEDNGTCDWQNASSSIMKWARQMCDYFKLCNVHHVTFHLSCNLSFPRHKSMGLKSILTCHEDFSHSPDWAFLAPSSIPEADMERAANVSFPAKGFTVQQN